MGIGAISTGMLGESVACQHLQQLGYTIIARNFRAKGGELDIVAQRGDMLHFVEVKTVSHESGGGNGHSWHAVENLHTRKLQRLKRAIYEYLSTFHVKTDRWQLDAVLVKINRITKEATVELIEAIG